MGKPMLPDSGLVPLMLGSTVGYSLLLIVGLVPRMREKDEGKRVLFDEAEPVPRRLGRGVGRRVSLEEEPNRDTVTPVTVWVLRKNEEEEAPGGPTILPEPEVKPAVPLGFEGITPLPVGSPVKSGR